MTSPLAADPGAGVVLAPPPWSHLRAPIHLGVITTSYPRDETDYAGRFVRRELQQWVAHGHRVSVVTPRSDRPDASRPTDRGIRVFEAPTPRAGLFYGEGAPEQLARSPWRARRKIPAAVAALAWTGRRALASCDALVGHWLVPSGPLCAWLARGRPWGVVAHSGGGHLIRGWPSPLQRLLAHQLTGAAWITASSPALAQELRARLRRPVLWRPPVAETAPLQTLPPPVSDGVLTLGFLGRRVPIKGLDLLLDVTRRVQARGAPVRLLVAGPGDPLEATDGIEDLGELRGAEELRSFFARLDALVVPSRVLPSGRTEGLPCVILEALAAARPVIASNVGGASALLEPRDLFPPDDASALEARLLERLTDEADITARGLTARAQVSRWL